MIRLRGGDAVFGWALGEYGPRRTRGSYPPPLYRQWVDHVVWREPQGQLWEVSPSVKLDTDAELVFVNCEFLPDPSAVFGRTTPGAWFETAVRYVPVRAEDEEAAKCLTLAQGARSHEERVRWIERAVTAVAVARFEPQKGVIQSVGEQTTSIVIYAD